MPEFEVDKAKRLVKDNWKPFVISAGIAGITCIIMRGRYVGIHRVPSAIAVRSLTFFSNRTNQIVNVIVRDGRGHPGYMVQCLETGTIYPSQAEAAQALGAYPSIVSSHLNGMQSNVHGFHLQRLVA